MMSGVRRSPLIPVIVLAVGGLAACGRSDSVDVGDVEDKVKEALQQEVGQEPESVDCDDDLKAEVGASVRCVLTADDGTRIGLTVTTTSVDGDDVQFDIQVDDEPMG
jgi:hypothetical protein